MGGFLLLLFFLSFLFFFSFFVAVVLIDGSVDKHNAVEESSRHDGYRTKTFE